jgi:hypothetical protein
MSNEGKYDGALWRDMNGRGDKCTRIYVETPGWKISLGKLKHTWEDNIKVGFIEMGWKAVDYIRGTYDMDQRRALVNTAMNLLGSVKWWEFLDYPSNSEGLKFMELDFVVSKKHSLVSLCSFQDLFFFLLKTVVYFTLQTQWLLYAFILKTSAFCPQSVFMVWFSE